MPPSIRVISWDKGTPPTEQEAEARLHQEGYDSFTWNDVAGAFYPRHRHEHDECLWIIKGEICFTVDGVEYPLKAGDRLYLPSGLAHTAQVPRAASCMYLVGQKKN